MSKDCLVTKLKGIVDNDNLKVLGGLEMVLTGSSAAKLAIKSKTAQTIKALSGTFVVSGQSADHVDIAANTNVTLYSGYNPLKILITDKYDILSLDCSVTAAFDLADLGFSQDLTLLSTYDKSGVFGDISVLSDKVGITTLKLPMASNVAGNVSDLANLVELTELRINNTNIGGNIADFATLTALTILKISGTPTYGTLESLVAGQRKNGRSTGTIDVGFLRYNPNITFNGVNPNDGSATLTWEPNSTDNTKTDVSYNGVTITIDANGNKVE